MAGGGEDVILGGCIGAKVQNRNALSKNKGAFAEKGPCSTCPRRGLSGWRGALGGIGPCCCSVSRVDAHLP